MKLEEEIAQHLSDLKKGSSLRVLKTQSDSSDFVDLSTNDYLGIAQNEPIRETFYSNAQHLALTASASRLLGGNHVEYDHIERFLAQLYHKSALFFNSGYHLNLGVLPSLSRKNDLILADKLIHASLIEALKLSPAKNIRYRHQDYAQLEQILEQQSSTYDRVFIVSESLFSMEGDWVDLERLVQIKEKYNAILYLDEAHAVGAYGPQGLGLAAQLNLLNKVDLLVGTMGKALASVGAFLICSETIKSYLVNTCRSLIYTTALPPINVAWSLMVLEQMVAFEQERVELAQKSSYLKQQLQKSRYKVVGDSHILSIVIGDNQACIEISRKCEQNYIKVQVVRPPTVPEGTSRIRLSVHQNIPYSELDRITEIFVSS